MKFAGLYNPSSKYNKDLDEYIIAYNPKKTKAFGEFVEQCQKDNKRVIAIIDSQEFKDFKFMGAICQTFPNVCVRFAINLLTLLHQYDDFIDQLQQKRIPFFFANTAIDWDSAELLLSLHPIALNIGGTLGFDLQNFKDYMNKEYPDVQIRAVPNMLIYDPRFLTEYKQFIIRPEDTDQIYSRYIDVYEIYGLKDLDSAFDVYYKTYAIDKQWNGTLDKLIPGFTNDKVDNRYLTNAFGLFRSTCNKQCQKGMPCTICPKLFDLSAAVAEKEKSLIENAAEK